MRGGPHSSPVVVCSVLLAIAAVAAVASSGGISGEPEVSAAEIAEPTFSGFLGDYSRLRPHPDEPDRWVYRAPDLAERHRPAFLVEPVIVYLLPDSGARALDPAELARLARLLREEMVKALEEDDGYEVVEEPGRHVVRVRMAITHVDPSGSKANLGTRAAATVLVPGGGLLAPRADLGGASIEAEFVDSESGERLAAVVAERSGRRFFSGISGMKRWGDVRKAFRIWAHDFRQTLDEIRASGGDGG